MYFAICICFFLTSAFKSHNFYLRLFWDDHFSSIKSIFRSFFIFSNFFQFFEDKMLITYFCNYFFNFLKVHFSSQCFRQPNFADISGVFWEQTEKRLWSHISIINVKKLALPSNTVETSVRKHWSHSNFLETFSLGNKKWS